MSSGACYSYCNNSSSISDRMSRARTPLGTVPISTIYGYDYPLLSDTAKDVLSKHDSLSDCVDYMVRSSRAFSENRLLDPYYSSAAVSSLSFMPSALRVQRERSLSPSALAFSSREPSPIRSTWIRYRPSGVEPMLAESARYGYWSSSPWNATGFYYYPRYPESYRGTASTYSPYCRRFPVRRYLSGYRLAPRYSSYSGRFF